MEIKLHNGRVLDVMSLIVATTQSETMTIEQQRKQVRGLLGSFGFQCEWYRMNTEAIDVEFTAIAKTIRRACRQVGISDAEYNSHLPLRGAFPDCGF